MAKPTMVDKLRAMADPKRNSNEHERAVAAKKLEAILKAQGAGHGAWKSGMPFTVAAYARVNGLNARLLRKKLRAAGKAAPYTLRDLEGIVG
jgi:hypothetical protein